MRWSFILLILFVLPWHVDSQTLTRRLATQRVQQRLLLEHPELAHTQAVIENYVQSYQKQDPKPLKVTIPVVFHVLYQPGQDYPDEAQILSQLDALNRDFNKEKHVAQHPADTARITNYLKRAAKMDIEFCLPKYDPSGQVTSGINFVATDVAQWTADDAIKSAQTAGAAAWNPEAYLNIWVGRLVDSVSGYAQMPGGPAATDGIVIDYRFLGTTGTAQAPYQEGKTLTHLVGNYLGLHDLWGEYERCRDDFVKDTPVHNAPNTGQPLPHTHLSTCETGRYPVEMTMNYMDNTDDASMYMFTVGQKLRIHAVLSEGGPRYKLVAQKTKCDNAQLAELPTEHTIDSSAQSRGRFSLFPNPAQNKVIIQVEEYTTADMQAIYVHNLLGMRVHQLEITSSDIGLTQYELDCSTWPDGVYLVTLKLREGHETLKLLITRN